MLPTTVSTRQLTFRAIGIILGAVLMTAGFVKGLDIHLFVNQINQYGLLPDDKQIIGGLAWIMVVLEIGLGAALVVNWRPKTVIPAVMVMLLTFIGTLIWAIIKGGVDDCGCFGPAAVRSPAQALFEDLILLLAAISAWYLSNEIIHSRHPAKRWAVALACAFGLALPLATGPLPWTDPAPASIGNSTGLVLQSSAGEAVDFKDGTTLIAVMSTECQHCRESVPLLNDIIEEVGETIQVYGVAADEQIEIDRFIEENFTFYPILPIDQKSLTTLLGDDSFPKYLLIQKGDIVAQWSGDPPSSQTLIDLAAGVKGA